MVKRDLYATLGVDRNATPEEIKKAHRRRSKLSHPDVDSGNDSEEFLAVQLAYEVLRDQDRRERYDQTGQTAQPKFSLEVEIANLLIGILDMGVDERADLISMARTSVIEGISGLEKQRQDATRKAKAYRAAARRLKFKKNNIIHEALENKARAMDVIAAEIPDRIKVGQSILALLKEAEYEAEKPREADIFDSILRRLVD